MRKIKTKNIICSKNSMERSIAKLKQIISHQEKTIAEIDVTLKKADKILLNKMENYLKLQLKFLDNVFVNTKSQMESTIKAMEGITEKFKKRRDQIRLKKIRKQLFS